VTLTLFLASAAGDPAGCANAMMLPMMLLLFFYVLVWRPQQKQLTESKRFRDGLKVGDRVVTSGGILGRIHEVDGEVIVLEVAPSTRVRVLRSQIAQAQSGDEPVDTTAETKRQERRTKS
jgi:preprotein translocase subunit YajC